VHRNEWKSEKVNVPIKLTSQLFCGWPQMVER
jgi:hypothetical protein